MALVGGSWVSLHNFNEYDCVAVPNARVLPRFFVTAWRSFSLDSLGESSEEHTRRAIVAGNSRNRACCYIRGTPGAAARGIVSGRPGEQRASCGTSVDWRQSGVRWAVFVAVSCLACSAPHESERATPTRPPPAIDAAASATIIVDAPTIADASMPPDAALARKPFPFEELHTKWLAYRQSRRHVHPCDWRDRNDWTPERMATCPDGPGALAAFIRRKRPTKDGTATDLEIDQGSNAFVDDTWSGALLDHADVPLTPWLPIKVLGSNASILQVPFTRDAIADLHHVALRAAHDPNPRGGWQQTYP